MLIISVSADKNINPITIAWIIKANPFIVSLKKDAFEMKQNVQKNNVNCEWLENVSNLKYIFLDGVLIKIKKGDIIPDFI